MGASGFNRTVKTIGSIRNRQVNFTPEHTFFNPHEHMPQKAQHIREIVQGETDKDLLGTKSSKWSNNVCLPKDFDDNSGLSENRKKFLIRKGFEDETITQSKPQTTYAGIDTRDVYYHGWDVSVEKTPPRDKQRQYQMERVFIMDKTTRIADVLLKNQKAETVRYGIKSDKYLNPELISTRVNEKIRQEKDQEQ
jgi:hypothetical protein